VLTVHVILFVGAPKHGLSTVATDDPDFSSAPKVVAAASADFQRCENFLRGCLWSVYCFLLC